MCLLEPFTEHGRELQGCSALRGCCVSVFPLTHFPGSSGIGWGEPPFPGKWLVLTQPWGWLCEPFRFQLASWSVRSLLLGWNFSVANKWLSRVVLVFVELGSGLGSASWLWWLLKDTEATVSSTFLTGCSPNSDP